MKRKLFFWLMIGLLLLISKSFIGAINAAEIDQDPHVPRVPYNWDDYEVPESNKLYHDHW